MESIDFISFDFMLLGIILLSGLIAFFRGFIQESLSLALWVFAFAASMFLDEYLDPYISVYITNDELKRIASLFIIFTGIIFSGGFAIKILKKFEKPGSKLIWVCKKQILELPEPLPVPPPEDVFRKLKINERWKKG